VNSRIHVVSLYCFRTRLEVSGRRHPLLQSRISGFAGRLLYSRHLQFHQVNGIVLYDLAETGAWIRAHAASEAKLLRRRYDDGRAPGQHQAFDRRIEDLAAGKIPG